jgi:hypothetical protein
VPQGDRARDIAPQLKATEGSHQDISYEHPDVTDEYDWRPVFGQ